MLSPDDYLTVEDAAASLGIGEVALRCRIMRGTIDSVSFFGRRLIHKATVANEKKKTVRRGRPKQ